MPVVPSPSVLKVQVRVGARCRGVGCSAVIAVVIREGELRVGEGGVALGDVSARFRIGFHHGRGKVA